MAEFTAFSRMINRVHTLLSGAWPQTAGYERDDRRSKKDTSNTDMETALIQAAVLFFVFAVMVLTGKIFIYFRNESHRASLLNSRCHELLTDFQRKR